MTLRHPGRTLSVLLLASLPTASLAQERGRTDGPEGSEYGKGGYSSPGGGNFSLSLSWGAAVAASNPPLGQQQNGAPLFVGLNASLWIDEWFVMDFSPSHLFNNGRTNLFIGPRFRTIGYPVSASLGVQAGASIIPDVGLRFALSPQVGVDALLGDHYLLGLTYALDFPVSADPSNHRLFMTLGYRF